jgi:hypothetical protein
VERAVQVQDLSRDEAPPEMERLDLFILVGGAGIFFDGESEIFIRELEIAQKKRFQQ